MDSPVINTPSDRYAAKLKSAHRELREEYLLPHDKPWIIGFSGGKDSTLLAHLVFECLLAIPPDARKRRVYIVCNDTLVESPVFQSFVENYLSQMKDGISNLFLPIEVIKTHPLTEESFWVNLLGKGYPAPNRSFRWCTDRMKIRPTSRFIRQIVTEKGEAILLLGVRSAESAARAANIEKHADAANGRLSAHADHKGCWIFNPIKDFTTEEVWITLLNSRPPWGGSYRELVLLYKSAQSGECPFIMSNADAPSCGTNSARFGCWTCTVVDKDHSLASMVAAGNDDLEPLLFFRDKLKAVSEDPNCRSHIRRNGKPGLGPLKLETRKQLLDELLEIQSHQKMTLISDAEVRLIQNQWAQDQAENAFRDLERSCPVFEPLKRKI